MEDRVFLSYHYALEYQEHLKKKGVKSEIIHRVNYIFLLDEWEVKIIKQ